MNRALWAAALLGGAALSHAAPLFSDGFSIGFDDVVKPGTADYERTTVDLGQDFLGRRSVSSANYNSATGAPFTISGGAGLLTATGTGDARGLMELTYNQRPSGVTDLTGALSVTFDVVQNTEDLTGFLGFYSGGVSGFDRYSFLGFSLPAGFTGTKTLLLSSLGNDPLAIDRVGSMFFDFDVARGATLSLSNVSVQAVPEPSAGLVLLALPLARRLRGTRSRPKAS